jgi:protein phosphatase
METLSIGEFARRFRLSPKALRLYDQMGLLLPARVDAASGLRLPRTRPPRPRGRSVVREHVCDASAAHHCHGLSAAIAADGSGANWAFPARRPPARRARPGIMRVFGYQRGLVD